MLLTIDNHKTMTTIFQLIQLKCALKPSMTFNSSTTASEKKQKCNLAGQKKANISLRLNNHLGNVEECLLTGPIGTISLA